MTSATTTTRIATRDLAQASCQRAAYLSLATGYCAVAKRNGKQPAKAKAEPYAGPLITERASFGPAGPGARSRSAARRQNALRSSLYRRSFLIQGTTE
jgi:hypothetical protein